MDWENHLYYYAILPDIDESRDRITGVALQWVPGRFGEWYCCKRYGEQTVVNFM